MIKSLQNTAMVCAASILTGGICALIAWQFEGQSGAVAAGAAMLVNVFVACVAASWSTKDSIHAVMAATLIRLMLTVGTAGAMTLFIEPFRGPSFLLTLGVGYLASLFVKTWLTLRDQTRIMASTTE